MELRNSYREESTTSASLGNGEILKTNNFFAPLIDIVTPIFSHSNETFIAFTGIGALIDRENQYVFPILKAGKNVYSATQYEPSAE